MKDTTTIRDNINLLPRSSEFYSKLKQLRKVKSEEDLETFRVWTFEKLDLFVMIVQDILEDNLFKHEEFQLLDIIQRLHLVNSGLIGLVSGLHETAVYIPYKELTESSRGTDAKKQKLTAQDRERYAKGEASDLKGTLSSLEETQKNLWERMQILRDATRRR